MPPLDLSEDEVQQLQSIASSRSLPHSIVQRAQSVLACGAGETNTSITKRMGRYLWQWGGLIRLRTSALTASL